MENTSRFFQRIFGDERLSRVEKMRIYKENAAGIQAADKAILRRKFEELKPRIQEAIATWEVGMQIDFPFPKKPRFEMSSKRDERAEIFFVFYKPVEKWCIAFEYDKQTMMFTDLVNWYKCLPGFDRDGWWDGTLKDFKKLSFGEVGENVLEWFLNHFDKFEEKFYCAVDAVLQEQDETMAKREQEIECLWAGNDAALAHQEQHVSNAEKPLGGAGVLMNMIADAECIGVERATTGRSGIDGPGGR